MHLSFTYSWKNQDYWEKTQVILLDSRRKTATNLENLSPYIYGLPFNLYKANIMTQK